MTGRHKRGKIGNKNQPISSTSWPAITPDPALDSLVRKLQPTWATRRAGFGSQNAPVPETALSSPRICGTVRPFVIGSSPSSKPAAKLHRRSPAPRRDRSHWIVPRTPCVTRGLTDDELVSLTTPETHKSHLRELAQKERSEALVS